MTDADKVMNSEHFGSDPAGIQIQIWINLEIQIWILDHFCLGFDALAEVFALGAQCSLLFFAIIFRHRKEE